LLRQAFRTVPRELADAAALDGYSHPAFLARVVVPINRPIIATIAVFSSWPRGVSTSGRSS
jgi:sn-glycerol 3-phosphate transport system permease protein